MRVLILSILLICLARSTYAIEKDSSWSEFRSRFNKSYGTEVEEVARRRIFLDNLKFIEQQNIKSRTEGSSMTFGPNEFSDLSPEEFKTFMLGAKINLEDFIERQPVGKIMKKVLESSSASLISETFDFEEKDWRKYLDVPEKLDYRKRGMVSKVKNQGQCGSCWAFATTGALESILAERSENILLSEQNLMDCSVIYGTGRCGGGFPGNALEYVRDFGIMAESDYPYEEKNRTSCDFVKQKSVMNVEGYEILPPDENLLKVTLAMTRPIITPIHAPTELIFHESGVYRHPDCVDNVELNHAVLVVGYGNDPKEGDYWIIKNSWGESWGDKGFMKLARNAGNMCGIAHYPILPLPYSW